MPDNPIGRPTVMTPVTIDKLEEAFEWGCSDLEACLHAGIGKTALYDYQTANPDFAERKEQLKKNPTLRARRTVYKDIAENSDLALKYLERKEKDEFSTKTESDHNLTFTQMPKIEVKQGEKKTEITFNVGDSI